MDIYAYAESIDWLADYYDFHTGLTYAITEYKKNPDLPGIPVYEGGNLQGYAKRKGE